MTKITRKTKETNVEVILGIYGTGKYEINTGLNFLNHMLESFSKHSFFDLKINVKSLDKSEHHLVEDIGICLGQALEKETGSKAGIERFGYAIVPMDEAVATVAVDLSGRPFCNLTLPFSEFQEQKIEDTTKENIEHFLESFAINAKLNLCANVLGKNDHHKVEALFKALARALRMACSKTGKGVPSTKGKL